MCAYLKVVVERYCAKSLWRVTCRNANESETFFILLYKFYVDLAVGDKKRWGDAPNFFATNFKVKKSKHLFTASTS